VEKAHIDIEKDGPVRKRLNNTFTLRLMHYEFAAELWLPSITEIEEKTDLAPPDGIVMGFGHVSPHHSMDEQLLQRARAAPSDPFQYIQKVGAGDHGFESHQGKHPGR
jgi:hypothetical protein